MKVYDLNLNSGSAVDSSRAQELQKPGTVENGVTGRSTASSMDDRIEFSATLGRLSRALSVNEQDRSARVEALTGQYQSGGYVPNPLATGRGLVAEALAQVG